MYTIGYTVYSAVLFSGGHMAVAELLPGVDPHGVLSCGSYMIRLHTYQVRDKSYL